MCGIASFHPDDRHLRSNCPLALTRDATLGIENVASGDGLTALDALIEADEADPSLPWLADPAEAAPFLIAHEDEDERCPPGVDNPSCRARGLGPPQFDRGFTPAFTMPGNSWFGHSRGLGTPGGTRDARSPGRGNGPDPRNDRGRKNPREHPVETPPIPVPEPSTLLLTGSALAGVFVRTRRNRAR
jgi:hypothetical protein